MLLEDKYPVLTGHQDEYHLTAYSYLLRWQPYCLNVCQRVGQSTIEALSSQGKKYKD